MHCCIYLCTIRVSGAQIYIEATTSSRSLAAGAFSFASPARRARGPSRQTKNNACRRRMRLLLLIASWVVLAAGNLLPLEKEELGALVLKSLISALANGQNQPLDLLAIAPNVRSRRVTIYFFLIFYQGWNAFLGWRVVC